jgi:hypothetical protein
VPAGRHDIRYTDWLGIPIMTTVADLQPGMMHQLSFRFGGWRNRVHDGHGTDVTKFGMWSNYLVMLITFGAIGVLCCGGTLLLSMLSSSSPT